MTKERDIFEGKVIEALKNPFLQSALDRNAERRKQARLQGYASLPQSFEWMREKAHEIKRDFIDHWEEYLQLFTENARKNGFHIHYATQASTAHDIVIQLLQERGAKIVVKAKTMIGEEIHINKAIIEAGASPIETDLGEYIVQLRGETPAHIITPAVHLRREDVAQTFTETLGVPYNPDVKVMTKIAREKLRELFLCADVGISGVNFGVAETGSLCILSNEGNARMVTTIPKLHIALLGIERLVPTLNDLGLLLNLLPRSATGQKLTNYVSVIQNPRQKNDADGAEERHIILVDNGRKQIAESEFKEILYCIRCGACLNACPIFREIGGHAYQSPYMGPIGSVLSPLLFGDGCFGHLAKASSLCEACEEACPVAIPFSKLLPKMRYRYVNNVNQPWLWRLAMGIFAYTACNPPLYRMAQKIAARVQPLFPKENEWTISFPHPLSRWTRKRDFPPAAKETFLQCWITNLKQNGNNFEIEERLSNKPLKASLETSSIIPKQAKKNGLGEGSIDLLLVFQKEWESLEGKFIYCTEQQFEKELINQLHIHGVKTLLSWNFEMIPILQRLWGKADFKSHLNQMGVELIFPEIGWGNDQPQASIYRNAEAGLSGSIAAFSDSGTIVLTSGKGMPLINSLMPRTHFAVLSEKDIYPSMNEWLAKEGKRVVQNSSCVLFVSGPSRTADIEMTLTVGVHGPEKVILFCIKG